jgi:hypothetical protein
MITHPADLLCAGIATPETTESDTRNPWPSHPSLGFSRRDKEVVLPCHSTRPPPPAGGNAFAQVDGPVLCLPPLGTVLRRSPDGPPVHPTDPLVASLPVQRRLVPDEVAELVAAYRRGVPVAELAASFQVNRTTVLGHVRRHGVRKRDRRALQGEEVDRAAQLYAGGQSADWVAAQLGVAPSTVRRALKDAGVALRPGGRRRRANPGT